MDSGLAKQASLRSLRKLGCVRRPGMTLFRKQRFQSFDVIFKFLKK
jgi:hypothetical protein